MSDIIKIVPEDFEEAINEISNKRAQYETISISLMDKLQYSSSETVWNSHTVFPFKSEVEKIQKMQNDYIQNLYFIENILRQTQLDFEAADKGT